MTWPIVLLIVIFLVFLILMVRIGSVVEYGADGFTASVRVGVFRVSVYPARLKKEKEQKAPKKTRKPEPKAEPEPKRGGDLAFFRELLSPVLRAASDTRRRLRIDFLYIDFTAASENPATAALSFGSASAALGALIAVLENSFTVHQRSVRTRVDYTMTKPEIYVKASLSLRLWKTLSVSLRLGWHVLRALRRKKREQRNALNQTTAAVKP